MVKIVSVSLGEVTVNRTHYFHDAIVWWDGKVTRREKEPFFGMQDYLALKKRKPKEIVIISLKEKGLRVADEVSERAIKDKIHIHVQHLENAIELFNLLAAQKKRVVAVVRTT